MEKITYVNGDDWVGLYIGDKLAAEGHSLTVRDVLDALGFKHNTVYPDMEWLEDSGYLPKNLKDVKIK